MDASDKTDRNNFNEVKTKEIGVWASPLSGILPANCRDPSSTAADSGCQHGELRRHQKTISASPANPQHGESAEAARTASPRRELFLTESPFNDSLHKWSTSKLHARGYRYKKLMGRYNGGLKPRGTFGRWECPLGLGRAVHSSRNGLSVSPQPVALQRESGGVK
jgi:hypothetical protein